MKNDFFGKDVISVNDYSREDLELLFSRTNEMKKLVEERGGDERLKRKMMAALFYEPSSRTFSSFISAMQRLGGGIIPLNGMTNTSVAKGETLEDTARVFSAYVDVLVIRHSQAGSLATAAKYCSKPIINAGEGATGEHPTQAFIDLFTIKKIFGRIEGLHFLIIGDLAHYRPTNSLMMALTNFKNITLTLATPKQVPIQDYVRKFLKVSKISFSETSEFDKLLPEVDVLYVTRVKKEYMSESLYREIQGSYIVNNSLVKKMKKKSLIMHCLPRIDEIDKEVDDDPRSVYFRDQLQNGLYVRMALLDLVLNKD
ncbi:aspartate carbamoyltransferase [Candidatus Gottesmanbacteria bacterium RIFCSPLOWO2_01_FULL_39_12b]|uniref:Aspartate carbamoyltransferase n=1 Tax=Candidatus Gottesmanbacteria bacterium RIFCSPLOWO2_01_FULL_39_12b TaxID=1798388 RepID=A0A1F6AQ80_9BACT|nr:MAG: aspartate carbamoyltransferase [Candidatus Gottesmanbacteria bacterium RIFCSPLOWO2_01_FULL_39_12b]